MNEFHPAQDREVAVVAVLSLLPGESPRLEGPDEAHIARLAEIEGPLPPILVDRRTMRVIDGTHRLMAAARNGHETIEVEYFEGSGADAFLRAVQANVTHGFPLSQADRRAAAERIIASHPQMSDRAIAESAGLGAKTVASIRRRSTDALPQLDARVGRDGKVRPLSGVAGRKRAAELMAEFPLASLREVARNAGVSPATVSDVRKRLARGEEPVPSGSADPQRTAADRRRGMRVVPAAPPATLMEKLLRDPSLRHNEEGRRLLHLLRHNAFGTQEWSDLISAVPPHCAALVVQLAKQYADMWTGVAQQLGERARSGSAAAVNVAGASG